jgi:hypothetical protein
MISSIEAVHFPTSTGAVPPLDYAMSPGGNEHDQEHHANRKFGCRQIRRIYQFGVNIYIICQIYVFFNFFCNYSAILALPGAAPLLPIA